MKTKLPIHPEWLSQTITRFYHFGLLDWNVAIFPDGSWKLDKRIKREG